MMAMAGAFMFQEQASSSRHCSHSRKVVRRNRVEANQRLMQQYFVPNPTYDARFFRRRFQIPLSLFNRVMSVVVQHDPYFQQGRDAAGRLSFSPEQKLTTSLWILSNGCSADSLEETFDMGETTVLQCMRKFCNAIICIYGPEYLRSPNMEDLRAFFITAINVAFRV
ncbi:unnamed protein product [Linum trigynum]|uniref:Uncharacterized protein n=1 Tax=Linum trigynum TaxID=586398 RepID=A0AAV2CSL6_9ROSI